MQESSDKNTKGIMARMGNQNDQQLVASVFKAFLTFHADYQKNKELEDRVKESEKQMAEFLKSKSDGAKKMLTSIAGNGDAVVTKLAWDAWVEMCKDAKKEAELAEALSNANAKFSNFGTRNGKNARSVMEKQKLQVEYMIMLRVLISWRLDARVEFVSRIHNGKVDAKRQQLVGVQHMFRNFASQLEVGLKDQGEGESNMSDPFRGGNGTDREFQAAPSKSSKKSSKRMQKHDQNSNSLPDIHQKGCSPAYSGTPKSGSRKSAAQPTE